MLSIIEPRLDTLLPGRLSIQNAFLQVFHLLQLDMKSRTEPA
jgi:hypothetical protein